MKPFFVADVHVGNHRRWGGPVKVGLNNRAREVLDALRLAVGHTNNVGEPLVVLGDLFDTASPSPQMVYAVGEVLGQCENGCYVLLGNHEFRSADEGDHALTPLSWLENVEVVDVPTLDGRTLFVPFQPGPAKEWLPDVLAGFQDDSRPVADVLCLHLGIEDGETPPWLRGADDSVTVDQLIDLAKEYGFREVYAGNWHKHKA